MTQLESQKVVRNKISILPKITITNTYLNEIFKLSQTIKVKEYFFII